VTSTSGSPEAWAKSSCCRSSQAGQREIDLNLHVGARLPAYCTSLGKVLLAYLPPELRAARLERVDFAQRGPNTITSRDALSAELERVLTQGFAINNEELAYGLACSASPPPAGSTSCRRRGCWRWRTSQVAMR
jgi:DNA-binding IclR family transcriptional regulator